jgi:spore coat polysaccharide biosynthesis protein SpsF
MRTVAIVQARMGSSRLPGKSLMRIAGKPMLAHVLERLSAARTLDHFAVATSIAPRDAAIVDLAREMGAEAFAGSEEDVLDRTYQAAQAASAEAVVRITGDCPLIDPQVVDRTVAFFKDTGADYVRTSGFPRGLDTEVFSFHNLARAWKEASRDYEREHVTPYFYQNPELFRVRELAASEALHRPELRLCVDTEEDLTLVREIYTRLYVPPGRIFTTEEVIAALDAEPHLKQINAHVVQKTVPTE